MARTSMRGFFWVALLGLMLAGGCKCGQPGGAPDAGTTVSAEPNERAEDEVRPVYPAQVGAPSPLAQRLCAAFQELPARRRAECCGGSPGMLLTGECVRMLGAALSSGAVKLEASSVDACVQALEQAHQGCDWVGPQAPPVPSACLGILRGTLASGARCRSALECVEGLRCQGVGPTDTGVCGPPGAPGQLCSLSVDALATYTRQDTLEETHPECQGHCSRRVCTEPVPLGGACVHAGQCAPGLHCASSVCTEGERAALGQPCVSGECQEGSSCLQGVCATLKPTGAACERDEECRGGCVRPDGGRSGTCGPRCGPL